MLVFFKRKHLRAIDISFLHSPIFAMYLHNDEDNSDIARHALISLCFGLLSRTSPWYEHLILPSELGRLGDLDWRLWEHLHLEWGLEPQDTPKILCHPIDRVLLQL